MADSLEILKEKYRANGRAYIVTDGIFKFESSLLPEAFIAQLRLDPDDECVDRLRVSLETLVNLSSYKERKQQHKVWVTGDEWVETLSWCLLKKPRTFAKTWEFWISACFDALDGDEDGFINEDEFNIFYQTTTRKDDKKFAARAFAVFDPKTTGGIIARKQFIGTFVRYFTDPETKYDDLPLY